MGGVRGSLVTSEVRIQVIALVKECCDGGARKSKACELLGVCIRTVERWEKSGGEFDKRKEASRIPNNKLTEEERQVILETVNRAEYRDLSPCKIVPLLADAGCYIGSESSIYRLLRAENQLTHRQASRPIKHHKPKAYVAHAGNQVWTWDISYLPSTLRGYYFYLYLIVDIYSRKIVGFSVHDVELSEYAAKLMKQACLDEQVLEDQLILHSDNGSPMKGASMLAMLQELGVIPSFSRPSVSDDNPYSEALFRTLKYHPTFPLLDKFNTIEAARIWCEKFVNWYNTQHLHSGLKFVTPQQRHNGEDEMLRKKRHALYQEAKKNHPERWSGHTRNWNISHFVTLNPNKKSDLKMQQNDSNFKLAV